ncbi:MAG: DUF3426 domain-containing protein [Syntrophaceae bacterium]|nr:DUF3426 domain-containing protein [Syntrophaceae bacterium]
MMNIQNEAFDLIREKQELDLFLSTFTNMHPSPAAEKEKGTATLAIPEPPPPAEGESNGSRAETSRDIHDSTSETALSAQSALPDAEVPKDRAEEEVAAAAPETERERPLFLEMEPDRQPEPPVEAPETAVPAQNSLSPEEAVKDPEPPPAETEAVALETEQEDSLSPEGESDRQPAPPVNQAPPAFSEFLQIGRPSIAVESRSDVPEMDRTQRIERKKIEEAAAENREALESAGDGGAGSVEAGYDSALPGIGRKSRRVVILSVLLFCLVLALAALGYSWLNPASGHGAVHWLSMHMPFASQYLEAGRPDRNPAGEQVGIVNLRQRLVRNAASGRDIRIIEGTAFNRGQENISKIGIRGELYDARGRLLAARISFCGSVIPVDQLEILGEEELRPVLSNIQANNQTNSVVPPGGQTPFMIVFLQEPAGVVQAMVEPVSMEKAR